MKVKLRFSVEYVVEDDDSEAVAKMEARLKNETDRFSEWLEAEMTKRLRANLPRGVKISFCSPDDDGEGWK